MTDETSKPRLSEPTGLSRRKLAVGAAWAVPAITIAGAAPAYAMSGPKPTFSYQGACKFPGNSCRKAPKGYAMAFTVTNNSSLDVYICNVQIATTGTDVTYTWTKPASGCIEIPANDTGTVYFFFKGSKDSSNDTFEFTITAEWGHSCPCSSDPDNHASLSLGPYLVTKTPPHGICQCGADFIT